MHKETHQAKAYSVKEKDGAVFWCILAHCRQRQRLRLLPQLQHKNNVRYLRCSVTQLTS